MWGDPAFVFHFSEDPHIERFEPHVPATNPTRRPAVWAIDEEHAPVYWFPRDCPRLSVWANDAEQQQVLTEQFSTASRRLCVIESARLDEVRDVTLFRYRFDATPFEPWPDADGQYVAHEPLVPIDVDRIDDVLELHVAAGVDVRAVTSLRPLAEQIVNSKLPFSIVRLTA